MIEPKSSRNFLYYITEYVEGQTLRQWMDENKEPPLVEARAILDQIALEQAARSIVETALANGSPDNLTCQLIRIDRIGTADKDAYFARLTALPFPPDLEAGMAVRPSAAHDGGEGQVWRDRQDQRSLGPEGRRIDRLQGGVEEALIMAIKAARTANLPILRFI